jgi:excisionase family DNA binding protein
MSEMTTAATPSRLLTIPEVAERLRVSRQTIYRAVASGRLPAVQLGGPGTPLRIDEAEFQSWLFGQSPAGVSPPFYPAREDPTVRGDPRGEVDSPQPAGQEEPA